MTEVRSPDRTSIQDLAKQIHSLEAVTGAFSDHISLYVPPERGIPEVTGYLRGRAGISYPGTHTATQARIRESLYTLISRVRSCSVTPPNGIAGFCRGGPVEGSESPGEGYCTVFEPPEPVNTYLFCRSTIFELEPLRRMLDGEHYGWILLDRRVAYWCLLHDGRIGHAGSLSSDVPGKQHKGGQSALRFQRLRVNAIREFYRRVGEDAGNFFQSQVVPENLRGIFIGGPGPTREEFARGSFLPVALGKKILGTCDITPVTNENLSQLAAQTEEMIRDFRVRRAKDAAEEFLKHLKKETGLAAYGRDVVFTNLRNGAVRTLLISRSLQGSNAEITCNECGHTGERTFRLGPGDTVEAILATACRVCATPVLEDEDLNSFGELIQLAHFVGAKTEIVPESTGENSAFLTASGGIGAILRYPAGNEKPRDGKWNRNGKWNMES